jgi:hypothetical protein
MSDGAEMIAAERQRQIAAEGWTPEHDDRHTNGELAWAATCYAAPETVVRIMQEWQRDGLTGVIRFEEPWPVGEAGTYDYGKPRLLPWRRPAVGRITELVKAGALIAAEIDRLTRAAESGGGEQK